MTGQGKNKAKPPRQAEQPVALARKKGRNQPDWADGLRQLYDSVVEEPLPDSFKDLLSKLDDGKA